MDPSTNNTNTQGARSQVFVYHSSQQFLQAIVSFCGICSAKKVVEGGFSFSFADSLVFVFIPHKREA